MNTHPTFMGHNIVFGVENKIYKAFYCASQNFDVEKIEILFLV